MRVLIANHHLAVRAGSELATLELGLALRDAGHSVALFGLEVGSFAEQIVERWDLPVWSRGDTEQLQQFGPDRILAHHWPTLLWLEQVVGLRARWLIGFLGTVPALENPPPLGANDFEPRYYCISEEVRANLSPLPGWRNGFVLGNWYVDDFAVTAPPVIGQVRRIAVVSNHVAPEVRSAMASAGDYEWVHYGSPANSVDITPSLISEFDAVLTIGRTAYLSLALGIPTYLIDVHGNDGWVRPENVEDLVQRNFSGRTMGRRLADSDLMQELSSPPSAEDRRRLQDWSAANARLSTKAGQVDVELAEGNRVPLTEMLGPWTRHVTDLYVQLEWFSTQRASLIAESHRVAAERDWWSAEFRRLRGRRSVRFVLRARGLLDRLRKRVRRVFRS